MFGPGSAVDQNEFNKRLHVDYTVLCGVTIIGWYVGLAMLHRTKRSYGISSDNPVFYITLCVQRN